MLALILVLVSASSLAVYLALCRLFGLDFLALTSRPLCGGLDSTLCLCLLGPELLGLSGLGCLVLILWVLAPVLGLILALRLFFGLDFLAWTLWLWLSDSLALSYPALVLVPTPWSSLFGLGFLTLALWP